MKVMSEGHKWKGKPMGESDDVMAGELSLANSRCLKRKKR